MALIRPSATMFDLAEGPELTLATGVITVTHGLHTVDTESDASTDDLVTINGGYTGQVIVLKRATSGRVVVVRDTGNIVLNGSCFARSDGLQRCGLVLDDDSLTLRYDGSNWIEIARGMGFLGVTLGMSSDQTLTDSTFTDIAWGTEIDDAGDWYDSGSSLTELVVPEGVFTIDGFVGINYKPNDTGLRLIRIVADFGTGPENVEGISQDWKLAAGAAIATIGSAFAYNIRCDPGTIFTGSGRQLSGGDLDVNSDERSSMVLRAVR